MSDFIPELDVRSGTHDFEENGEYVARHSIITQRKNFSITLCLYKRRKNDFTIFKAVLQTFM